MSLTRAMARAEAAEESRQRLLRLQRMSHYELRALLSGDPANAVVWVASAAEYGLPAAQLRLGRMLLVGSGTARDAPLALHWFKRAADQLDAEAMNMVGRCYENGWGVSTDLPAATHWYRLSAERGHDWGQYNFGNMLLDGRGIEANVPRALSWYACAARQGHSRAMNLLGRCCEEGWGCECSPGSAFEWYRRSAQAGYFRGQFNYAASLLDRGRHSEALDWFWRAATAGSSDMRQIIGERLISARSPAFQLLRERVLALPP